MRVVCSVFVGAKVCAYHGGLSVAKLCDFDAANVALFLVPFLHYFWYVSSC